MSTSQRAVMVCGWGVKAGIAYGLFAGKTVCCHLGPISALEYAFGTWRGFTKCTGLPHFYFYFT